jgi:hypothetical protein
VGVPGVWRSYFLVGWNLRLMKKSFRVAQITLVLKVVTNQCLEANQQQII